MKAALVIVSGKPPTGVGSVQTSPTRNNRVQRYKSARHCRLNRRGDNRKHADRGNFVAVC